ncbi:hypothetical protein [Bacillus cereus]|uniref:hypothetical protein n=1 Tax=Bacillus cereus TaxID=1396 RepID=UPI0015B964DD|nr:hypothetical protein [Bacillus cereus]
MVFSMDTTKVNKYGEITVDQERFVLRKKNVKQVIMIKKRMGLIYMLYRRRREHFYRMQTVYAHE